MRLYFTRDYGDRTGTRSRMSTGVFHNIGEAVSFRYIAIQVRRIGKVELAWMVR